MQPAWESGEYLTSAMRNNPAIIAPVSSPLTLFRKKYLPVHLNEKLRRTFI
jgi:hypothetical protein